jgi:sortase A
MVPSDAMLQRAGRALVMVGALVVAFASYQLWGTALVEHRAQQRLYEELRHLDTTGPAADPGSGTTTAALGTTDSAATVDRAPSDPPVAHATLPSPSWEARSALVETEPPPRSPEAAAPPVDSPLPAARAMAPAAVPPAEGVALGRLEIPAIGLSKAVLQGVGRDTLRQGPGHYPSSHLPGQGGNVAIAGHRTTYGAPFHDLDRLAPGDVIRFETTEGVFTYAVEAHDGPDGAVGHRIVDPSAVEVIADQGDSRLTLTACHPKYSARQRIVVSALLVEGPDGPAIAAPLPPPITPELPTGEEIQASPGVDLPGTDASGAWGTIDGRDPDRVDRGPAWGNGQAVPAELPADSLGWERRELDPVVLWATVVALIAHAGWVAGRLSGRPRLAYAATTPFAVLPLLAFFAHLDRLLPAI